MYSNDLICDILIYINNNIIKKITIEELSKKFYFNRHYIMRLFKKEIGCTILEYINRLRIYNSIQQINNTNEKFIKIALNNGFISLEYFSETFTKIMKVSPRNYKNFIKHRTYKREKDLENIRINLSELYTFINKVNKYENNRRPQTILVKKLSLFK